MAAKIGRWTMYEYKKKVKLALRKKQVKGEKNQIMHRRGETICDKVERVVRLKICNLSS